MELKGHFLIAMPQLMDSNFCRSVVLMMEHDEQGSIGLVVNRPGRLTASMLCTSQGLTWAGDAGQSVFVGGPVQPETVWILHGISGSIADSRRIIDGCWFANSMPAFEQLSEIGGDRIRFLSGYAGWGVEQLNAEVREGAWLTCEADLNLIFHADPEKVWELALRGVGIDPAQLVAGGSWLQ